eukprot:gene13574-biopygen17037
MHEGRVWEILTLTLRHQAVVVMGVLRHEVTMERVRPPFLAALLPGAPEGSRFGTPPDRTHMLPPPPPYCLTARRGINFLLATLVPEGAPSSIVRCRHRHRSVSRCGAASSSSLVPEGAPHQCQYPCSRSRSSSTRETCPGQQCPSAWRALAGPSETHGGSQPLVKHLAHPRPGAESAPLGRAESQPLELGLSLSQAEPWRQGFRPRLSLGQAERLR